MIRSPELAAKYAANWKVHADHSDPYAVRTEGHSQAHRAESTKPAAPATAPVTEGYVAFARSQVFHRADRKSVAKISGSKNSPAGLHWLYCAGRHGIFPAR